jgi:hypothetical protein
MGYCPKEWTSRSWLIKRECVTQHEISFLPLNDLYSTPRATINEQMNTNIPSGSSSLNAFHTVPDISNVDLVDMFNDPLVDPSTLAMFEEFCESNGLADQLKMSESVNQVIA